MNEVSDTVNIFLQDSLSQAKTLSAYDYFINTGKSISDVFTVKTSAKFDGFVIDRSENIWQFTFLLAMILLIAVLKAGFANRTGQFFSAILATRQLRQLMREENFLTHPFSMLLLFNTGVIYSLLAYKSAQFFEWINPEKAGIILFLFILAGILSLLLIKLIVLRMMEFITDTDSGQRENRYSWLLFHQFSGIILIPIAAIVLFGQSFLVFPGIILTGTILFIFLIFRIGKGVVLAGSDKVQRLHIFLYLCALEIMPLIVLIKVLISGIFGFGG